jgi:hypothetical protein
VLHPAHPVACLHILQLHCNAHKSCFQVQTPGITDQHINDIVLVCSENSYKSLKLATKWWMSKADVYYSLIFTGQFIKEYFVCTAVIYSSYKKYPNHSMPCHATSNMSVSIQKMYP